MFYSTIFVEYNKGINFYGRCCMKKERSEMILHGDIYKIIAIISIPIILNNFIQQLYSLADAFWLGKLGTAEFASTSFTWPVIFLFNSIGIGLSIAAISLISQLLGRNDFLHTPSS